MSAPIIIKPQDVLHAVLRGYDYTSLYTLAPETDEFNGHESAAAQFWYDELNFCGCGRPTDTALFMRDVLQAFSDRSDAIMNAPPRELFSEPTAAEKAASAKIDELLPDGPLADSYRYMLDAKGLTEHGGSIYGMWLTDLGREVLAMLSDGELQI